MWPSRPARVDSLERMRFCNLPCLDCDSGVVSLTAVRPHTFLEHISLIHVPLDKTGQLSITTLRNDGLPSGAF